MVSGMVAGRDGDPENTFIGTRDFAKVRVRVFPSGSPDRPGLGVMLRLTPLAGRVVQDVLNEPTLDPKEGPTWSGTSAAYQKRRRGPEEREKDPQLQGKVTLAGGRDRTIEKVLREFSHRSGLPLIGEYDPCFANPADRAMSRQKFLGSGAVVSLPAWKALDKVCSVFDLDWEFHDGWLWIRSPRTLRSYLALVDLSPPRNPATSSDVTPAPPPVSK
jgi:hypothetical protein